MRDERLAQRRPEIAGVLGEADAAGRHRQRRAERQLPDEEKRQPAADARPVHRAQIADGPACLRQRRAELGPDQPVARDEQRADDPPQHRLRPVHRRDHQRDRDERPDADHVDHVQDGGVPETDAADEARAGRLARGRRAAPGDSSGEHGIESRSDPPNGQRGVARSRPQSLDNVAVRLSPRAPRSSSSVRSSLPGSQAGYDLLITNGHIIDGTGQPARDGDIAIRAGRIVAVGRVAAAPAEQRIDAAGLTVSPGFIDESHRRR